MRLTYVPKHMLCFCFVFVDVLTTLMFLLSILCYRGNVVFALRPSVEAAGSTEETKKANAGPDVDDFVHSSWWTSICCYAKKHSSGVEDTAIQRWEALSADQQAQVTKTFKALKLKKQQREQLREAEKACIIS